MLVNSHIEGSTLYLKSTSTSSITMQSDFSYALSGSCAIVLSAKKEYISELSGKIQALPAILKLK